MKTLSAPCLYLQHSLAHTRIQLHFPLLAALGQRAHCANRHEPRPKNDRLDAKFGQGPGMSERDGHDIGPKSHCP